ncbi:hypothetical protein FRC10_005778 [Ceratobasidium sp. 414]|nr:hypothetical protein FRC10_005778 [Ceratobasidium sp. 414]
MVASESVLRNVQALVSKITRFEGIFLPGGEDHEARVFSFPLRLATSLNNMYPHITDLALCFDPEECSGDLGFVEMDETALGMLAELPLRKLSIEAAYLRTCHADSNGVSRLLVTLFPNLEVLRWMAQHVKYPDLCVFLDMPNLRHLGLQLQSGHMAARMLAHQPRVTPANHPLRIFEFDIKRKANRLVEYYSMDWFRTAKYIASIWPNVLIMPQARNPRYYEYNRLERLSDYQYELMNRFIAIMQGRDFPAAEWYAAVYPGSWPI